MIQITPFPLNQKQTVAMFYEKNPIQGKNRTIIKNKDIDTLETKIRPQRVEELHQNHESDMS